MSNRKVQYHIPQTSLWNWKLVSEYFVRRELIRTRHAMEILCLDEANLDQDILNVEKEIRGKWAIANANVMQAFEVRLRDLLVRRKRLSKIGEKLYEALKDLHEIGVQRKWNL